MIFVGVDPGKQGALALVDGERHELVPMPLVLAGTKGGRKQGRDEYDLPAILAQLRDWCIDGVAGESYRCLVTVEKAQPLPPFIRKGGTEEKKAAGGAIGNFNRGVMRGWEWMLVALGVPYQLVAPQTWQRAMLAGVPVGDTKQRAILAAQRLFPGVDLRRTQRSRKPSDGLADALLLAEFGRRTHNGGVS